MELWIYFLSAFVAFVIAFLTVSIQAVRAATIDPAKSLRYE
jgi:putative ABC transport system permease protein